MLATYLRPLPLAILVLSALSTLPAAVRMPLIFGDHMVLQQDIRLPIWGWADPGEQVTIAFAGQQVATSGGADGKWRVVLAPVATDGKGSVLTVRGTNTLTFQDVLVGDVWMGSGQSNMEFGIRDKKPYLKDVETCEDPLIRLFFVPRTTSLWPLEDILPTPLSYARQTPPSVAAENIPPDPCRARWLLCTPESVKRINGQGLGVVPFLFARGLRAHTGRPVGMIQSSWGGTRAESWTSVAGLQQDPPFTHYLERTRKALADFDRLEGTYAQRLTEHRAALATWLAEVGKPYDRAMNAWRAAVAQAKVAGQPLPPEPPAPASRRPSIHPPDNDTMSPGNLFNAMVAPLMPFAIKGVIWYQGEFNAGGDGGFEYRTLFPRMITSWRARWGQGDFPFIFVQLPNYGPVDTQPSVEGRGWRWLREAQLRTLALPSTAMVVSIDVGDPDDVHPQDKTAIGQRLVLAARRLAYQETIVAAGPIYEGMNVEGGKIRLTFKERGSGLIIGTSPLRLNGKDPLPPTELRGFGIAGADRRFVWARAVIEGDTVVVASDQVPAPVAVRYAFSNSPQGNLSNREGLPASPFRTDAWDDRDR